MPARELPASLTGQLRRAHKVEQTARRTHRGAPARDAVNALLLAAHLAAWQQQELATFLGMQRQTVHKRIEVTRRRFGDSLPALIVDAPLDRPPNRLAILTQPATEREWLTVTEAAEHAGKDRATIRNWLLRGVLPNTDRTHPFTFLYLRADLDRVTRAPCRGRRPIYPDFDRLLEQIAASPV